MENETLNLHYNDTDGSLTVSKSITSELMTLDEILAAFKQFLHAAGWVYVNIDEVGGNEGLPTSWVITKGIQRS